MWLQLCEIIRIVSILFFTVLHLNAYKSIKWCRCLFGVHFRNKDHIHFDFIAFFFSLLGFVFCVSASPMKTEHAKTTWNNCWYAHKYHEASWTNWMARRAQTIFLDWPATAGPHNICLCRFVYAKAKRIINDLNMNTVTVTTMWLPWLKVAGILIYCSESAEARRSWAHV